MRVVDLRLVIGMSLLIAESAVAFSADASKDEMQIREALRSITNALYNRDAVGSMEPYVKDQTLVEFDLPPPLSVIGYAGTLKTTQDVVDNTVGPVIVDYIDPHVTVDHNHAYVYSFVRISLTMKDGTKINLKVRATDVFEKQKGRWLIVHEHNSVPIDLRTGKADINAQNTGDSAIPFSTPNP